MKRILVVILLGLFSLIEGCTTHNPKKELVRYNEPVDIVYRNLDTGITTTNTVYVEGVVEKEIPKPEREPIEAEDIIEAGLVIAGELLDGLSGGL